MRVPRIYHPHELSPDVAVTLSKGAGQHLARVLRLPPGAPLILFNGCGGEYRAVLETVGKQGVTARPVEYLDRERESPLTVTLGQCIARGPRMDYILQKAVELGVSAIVPLFSERCEVRLTPQRCEGRLRHWQGVCVSACEQCGRNRVPAVLAPQPLLAWVDHHDSIRPLGPQDTPPLRLVLDPSSRHPLRGLPAPGDGVVMLSGPEGGLTEEEVAAARRCGFIPLRLGPRTLRAETAPVAALTAVQALWGDIGD